MALVNCIECGHQISDQAKTCPNCGFERLGNIPNIPIPQTPKGEDKVYYQDNNVLVTQSRFITGSKTYAMRNISSVQLGVISPNNTIHIIAILIGILMLGFGETGAKIAGGVIAAAFIYGMKQNKYKYSVRINSNSGEMDGLVSDDKQYVETIIEGINHAIVSHR